MKEEKEERRGRKEKEGRRRKEAPGEARKEAQRTRGGGGKTA